MRLGWDDRPRGLLAGKENPATSHQLINLKRVKRLFYMFGAQGRIRCVIVEVIHDDRTEMRIATIGHDISSWSQESHHVW